MTLCAILHVSLLCLHFRQSSSSLCEWNLLRHIANPTLSDLLERVKMASISRQPDSSKENVLDDSHPSFQLSDTDNASSSSHLTLTRPTSQEVLTSTPAHTTLSLDSSRTRAYSTASTSSNRSLKRKPLPSSASPLAARYESTQSAKQSSRLSLASSINTVIDPPFSRSTSGDSPTLYDNPLSSSRNSSQPPLPSDCAEKQRAFRYAMLPDMDVSSVC